MLSPLCGRFTRQMSKKLNFQTSIITLLEGSTLTTSLALGLLKN